MRSDGTSPRRLDRFGAYTWRAEGRLLLIPLEPRSASNRLLEVDASTGQTRELIDIGQTPLRIAESNWSLSPDGSRLAYVSAEDHNIWVLDLPQP